MPFQTIADFRLTTRVVHGAGSISRLPDLFPEGSRVLVVADKGLADAGIVDQATAVFDDAQIPYALFTDVVGNPVARNVTAGARAYAQAGCDAILGLGGGSPMDVAKMIGVLVSHGGRIDQYLGAPAKITGDIPPLFCAATTYGTGSEVTPFAVLTNPKTQNKDPVISWKIAPQVAVLDPELCVALPVAVGGPTGMDALTHAIESYTNLMATPLTESIALGAIELIGQHLRTACANDYELEATEQMLLASCMAGMAFSQTRLGNVHAMSHPVGAQFGVHHGIANAILLPHVMDFNLQARLAKFGDIAQALGEDTDGLSDYDAACLAVEQVRQLNDDLGIPGQLREAGVKVSGVAALSKAAMQSGNVRVNPRQTTLDDMKTLFRTAI
ncbi:MAG: iron-containing alcohol dehydrogenase [Candidatus Latescibacteria bacterium]|jgi:alcohol dehydrogenase class IV|nr:iron-containing alcohol dehydrogenase [Candidatus Latescibacterota bacterium]